MTKTQQKILLRCTLLASAALLPAVSQADHAWGSYHWARTSNPFTLKLGDNVNSTWDPYLVTASNDWTASSVLNTTIVAGGTTGRKCRPTSGRVEVCNAAYGNNGWLGLAQIWASGSHITQGTAKMNDTYHNNPPYNSAAYRRLVMCQEVAHDFGLDHQDENQTNANLGSCMDYTNDPDGPPSNEHPNAHDFDQLVAMYSHLDSTTTVGSLPFAPSAMHLDFDKPSRWGQLVHQSADQRSAKYELDFGGGNKILTHVFWAEGHSHGRHQND